MKTAFEPLHTCGGGEREGWRPRTAYRLLFLLSAYGVEPTTIKPITQIMIVYRRILVYGSGSLGVLSQLPPFISSQSSIQSPVRPSICRGFVLSGTTVSPQHCITLVDSTRPFVVLFFYSRPYAPIFRHSEAIYLRR